MYGSARQGDIGLCQHARRGLEHLVFEREPSAGRLSSVCRSEGIPVRVRVDLELGSGGHRRSSLWSEEMYNQCGDHVNSCRNA